MVMRSSISSTGIYESQVTRTEKSRLGGSIEWGKVRLVLGDDLGDCYARVTLHTGARSRPKLTSPRMWERLRWSTRGGADDLVFLALAGCHGGKRF